MFDTAALVLIVALWAVLGALPWLVLSVRRRGEVGFLALLLCVAVAVAAGLLVPALGLRDVPGLVVSLASAATAATLTLAAVQLVRHRQASWRPDPPRPEA